MQFKDLLVEIANFIKLLHYLFWNFIEPIDIIIKADVAHGLNIKTEKDKYQKLNSAFQNKLLYFDLKKPLKFNPRNYAKEGASLVIFLI